ncbi:MAG TPA: c-type cytochrome [Anaerolineaceae bacterium]
MNQFFRRAVKYLLYIPITIGLAVVGFLVGERRADQMRPHRLPDEIAREHPEIPESATAVRRLELPASPMHVEPEAVPVEPHRIRTQTWIGIAVLFIPFAVAIAAILAVSGVHLNAGPVQRVSGGDPGRGRQMIMSFGCGSCHTIAGIPGANGKVGPVLDSNLTQRSFIAGKLPNNPDNLMQWIMDPQGVTPGTDMPNMGVPLQSARDIAAYLYSLH